MPSSKTVIQQHYGKSSESVTLIGSIYYLVFSEEILETLILSLALRNIEIKMFPKF